MMPQTYAARSVAEAIKAACADLGCDQEQLEIEVLSPGMIGLFGICFKKAKIRVRRKNASPAPSPSAPLREGAEGDAPSPLREKAEAAGEAAQESPAAACQRLLSGMLAAVRLPLSVEVVEEGEAMLVARIKGDDIETVIGAGGEGIDALQYLVRKMLSKQFRRKITVTVDAGAYREQRREALEAQARQLAEEVKALGRSRATPPLNPAERRIVHMAIQGDPGVRSRSVGEGLYKKVVISPPGRRKGPGRRRRPHPHAPAQDDKAKAHA
ncbi:MAG TPA: hypothetical protein ENJ73_03170 [Desulfobacterales bacterium]|nr:hypothetical protein [Desulfobacterales bacterium]